MNLRNVEKNKDLLQKNLYLQVSGAFGFFDNDGNHENDYRLQNGQVVDPHELWGGTFDISEYWTADSTTGLAMASSTKITDLYNI